MGRVSKRSRLNISQSSNSEQLVDDEHYLYDANGRLIESKNQDSRIQLFYDSLGNLQKEHHRYLFLGKENTFVWRHQYDVLGNRTETLRPDGHRVAYLRYGSGHLHGMALNQHEIIAYQRDRLHRETERQMGLLNQQTIYDTMGRITQHNRLGINPRQRHYRYDMAGQMSHIRDSKNGTIRYQYDPLGRLIEAVTPLRHEQFAFDPAGNRLDGLSGSHTEKTTILNRVWGNLLENWLGKHYEYDQRGNLLAKSENGKQETFRWNSYNRLIQYTKDNQTTEYKYDPFGRRIAKIHNGTTILYHWDGEVLAAESNANSTTHYIFEPDTFEPVAQFVSAPLRPQTPLTFRDYTYYTPEIDPLNQEPTPQEYLPDSLAYFHLDHLGTPIEMTDRAGKTVWEASYKAWGEVEMVSGSLKQPFRFQGQYFDEESGLHYNRFRYYDPSSGRFVSQDPIGLLGGFNLYEYAPNPIGWVDPFGLTVTPLYTKDKNGRVERVQAMITKSDLDTGTGTNPFSRLQAKKMANCTKVDAGHFLAKRLGGSGGVGHVFPQAKSINRGQYKIFEAGIYKHVKQHGSAKIDISFFYPNANSQMPERIVYNYESGGKKFQKIFNNPNPCKL